MKAVEVLRLVSGALQDLEPGTEKRWDWTGGDSDSVGLLDFLNAAVRAVVLLRPDATARTKTVCLSAGARQTLPADALTLLELVRNMGRDGNTAGSAIPITAADVIIAMSSFAPCGTVVQQYAYDRMTSPRIFWVYPSVSDTEELWVEMTYSAIPQEVTDPEDPLPVSDTFSQALVHHMLAAILGGDNEASSSAKAQYHVSLWNGLMDIQQRVATQWPKTRSVA